MENLTIALSLWGMALFCWVGAIFGNEVAFSISVIASTFFSLMAFLFFVRFLAKEG